MSSISLLFEGKASLFRLQTGLSWQTIGWNGYLWMYQDNISAIIIEWRESISKESKGFQLLPIDGMEANNDISFVFSAKYEILNQSQTHHSHTTNTIQTFCVGFESVIQRQIFAKMFEVLCFVVFFLCFCVFIFPH